MDGRFEAYERWVTRSAQKAADYLYSERRARFAAWDDDVLVAPAELEIRETEHGCLLVAPSLGSVEVTGVRRPDAERWLARVDGRRTLRELRALAGGEDDTRALLLLLDSGLGSLLFVPRAVAELELELSGAEIVRFPGTPYEIVRPYWQNMIAVRREARASVDALADSDAERALGWLETLHVTALLGSDRSTFYRPASRIVARGATPGVLYRTATRLTRDAEGGWLLEGPRVGVGYVGGERYHGALYRAAGDPGALAPERELADEDGLAWGRVVHARAASEATEAAWFCPPRPFVPAHFRRLFTAFGAALDATARGDDPALLAELARFHWRFVRLHPFRCANQSLSMNLVNLVLGRRRGNGIPHLLLDQFALRLSEPAYARVFALAVEGHAAVGTPSERWQALRERTRRSYELIHRLETAADDAEALALARSEPEAARLALIAV